MGGRAPPRARVALWLIGACLTVAPILTCKRSSKDREPLPPPPPTLGSVEIQDVSVPAEGAAAGARLYDTEALAAIVRDRLAKSGVVMVPGAGRAVDGGAPQATVRVKGRAAVELVEVETKGLLRAAVALNVSTRPAETPGGLNEDLSAASEQPFTIERKAGDKVDRHALGQGLLERTVGDLVGGYAARVALTRASPEQLHAAIVSDAGALREEAVRIAGTRGLKAEVPALLPLLQSEDERLRDAALGALIAMREQRAVGELTRTRSMRDRHEMRKILEAIAILGGEEARDYLSFVAASHDDEEIRKLALDAKVRLERRGAAPDGGPHR